MIRLYDSSIINKQDLLFDNKALRKLLLPIMAEQFLNSLMGMADTMMVSRVGSAAMSAVSLVDSFNVLIIQMFAALATGAAIICSQYLGRKDVKNCNRAARQVTITVLFISVIITILCIIFCRQLLDLMFGQIDADVMQDSITYYHITVLSFPFLALSNAGSAFYRAGGESNFPMRVSFLANAINIAGNAILIFGFNMGVAGAAISTLFSRILCAFILFIFLRIPRQPVVIKDYLKIRPDFPLIWRILAIGIPSGIENSMFQFGKLAIQSSVSTLGTTAIAAQAMTIIMESLNGIAGIGIGIGLMTVVGQCMGAGRKEEAKYYIVKLSAYAEAAIILSCFAVFAITRPVTYLAGMEADSAAMCFNMVAVITIVKPLVWTGSFVPGYGMRAAGDVKFSMIVSSLTMWFCRVALCIYLIRFRGFGPMAVWIGMFADWTCRSIIYFLRFISGKWLRKKVI